MDLGPTGGPRMEARISLTVDGVSHSLTVDTRTTLLDALRDRLGISRRRRAVTTDSAGRARCCWTAGG